MASDLTNGLVQQEANDSDSVDSFPDISELLKQSNSDLVLPTGPFNPHVKGKLRNNLQRKGMSRPSTLNEKNFYFY